jgi:hypothetical protein
MTAGFPIWPVVDPPLTVGTSLVSIQATTITAFTAAGLTLAVRAGT